MSGKRGENRQSQGCRSRSSVAHLKRGECISNVWGAKVIYAELADFSLIQRWFVTSINLFSTLNELNLNFSCIKIR